MSVINTTSNTVVATVDVGFSPFGVSVSPDGTKAYVVSANGDNVSVINTTSNTVVATVAVGSNPVGVSVSPDGTKAYVANFFSDNVSVINTISNTVVATVAVGSFPYGVSVSPDGTKAYVANVVSNNVSVINTTSNSVVATVAVGSSPYSLGNFIANVPLPCSTLPLKLISFEINSDLLLNHLRWQTANETNTSSFVIERSSNGSGFTAIGNVPAKGSGSYSYTDPQPLNGGVYYRLKSIDKDGSFTYSKVVTVTLAVNGNRLAVYPNPSKSVVTISGNHIATVQVVNNLGRVISTQTLKDATNPSLSVSNLPAGIYHLRVQTTDGAVNSVGFVKE